MKKVHQLPNETLCTHLKNTMGMQSKKCVMWHVNNKQKTSKTDKKRHLKDKGHGMETVKQQKNPKAGQWDIRIHAHTNTSNTHY